jgi:hypothetical protein
MHIQLLNFLGSLIVILSLERYSGTNFQTPESKQSIAGLPYSLMARGICVIYFNRSITGSIIRSRRRRPSIDRCRFNNEFIEEGYRFIHGNVVISLTRYLTIPAEAQEMGQDGRPLPNKNLPPYESLNLLDGDNTWVMVAKMDISNGNDPELMQRGTAELLAIQAELEGLFHLQPRDRLIFETRIRATNG